jgi:alpha-tubulin suppressor-like RCC1 family protein
MGRVGAVVFVAFVSGCHNWGALSSAYGDSGPPACVAFVVPGDTHTCARRADGSLLCWGDNRYGQLGTGDTIQHLTPTQVNLSGTSVAKVYLPTGSGDITSDLAVFTCALRTDDSLACWGDNRSGQLGTGTMNQSLLPTPVMTLGTTVARAGAGAGYACAQTIDGNFWCWGTNQDGQLGIGSMTSKTTPTQAKALSSVDSVECGGFHACALESDNTLWCWGDNTDGQLGFMTAGEQTTPLQVTSLGEGLDGGPAGDSGATVVQKVSAGAHHTCAITKAGEVFCWGDNTYGQLGTGDTTSQTTPTPVEASTLESGGATVIEVYAGGTSTCALRSDATLWCWGDNTNGQLATGDTTQHPAPVQASPSILGNQVASASVGGAHACAVKTDGSVWCWGNNMYGQLGTGSLGASPTPLEVLPPCQ